MAIEFEILYMLFIHWVGDFLLQNTNMATNKSKSNYWLSMHVLTYTATWIYPVWAYDIWIHPLSIWSIILFLLVTGVSHFITDYFTSRWTSKLYKAEKWYGFPAFFSVIGLDQLLHFTQLILSYKYILHTHVTN